MVQAVKPVTASALQEILDTELVWRRRELTSLVTAIKGADLATKVVLIRAAVPLLYAHWEGFGRACFQRYLEHISYKNLRYKDLHPAFYYLGSYGKLQEIGRSPAKTAIPLLPELIKIRDDVNRNSFRKMIDTKSNLRFEVLEQLCYMSGIDTTPFQHDELFINHELCDSRNEIAHGAAVAPTEEALLKRRDRTFTIMTKLQTELVNAAVNGTYKNKI